MFSLTIRYRVFKHTLFPLKISFLVNTVLRNRRSDYFTNNKTENKHTPDERFTFDKLDKLVGELRKKLCQSNIDGCSQGPSSPSGPPGPRGERGERGRRGNEGRTVNKGDNGIMGPPGTSGKQGVMGPPGFKGDGKLTSPNAAGSDSGVYKCSASNILGKAQALVRLLVNGKFLFVHRLCWF